MNVSFQLFQARLTVNKVAYYADCFSAHLFPFHRLLLTVIITTAMVDPALKSTLTSFVAACGGGGGGGACVRACARVPFRLSLPCLLNVSFPL
jgi:hypothetical protein